jgi:hypothetical protein
MRHDYQIDHDELRQRWYVVDPAGMLLGNLSGFKSECEALNWIECDRIAPRFKCKKCKRVWKGTNTCQVCADTDAVLRQLA